jgi:DNA polymerase-3 subunit alpha
MVSPSRKTMKYVELRQHTEFSLGSACGTLEAHVKRVGELGGEVACITEVDTLRHVHALHDVAGKLDSVRPIFGTELSLVDDHRRHGLTEEERAKVTEGISGKREQNKAVSRAERALGMDAASRVAIRAMHADGLRNLFALSSRAWTDGFYRFPRFDFEILAAHGDGLLVTVGGAESVLGREITRGDFRAAARWAARLEDLLGDRLYLELHPHPGIHRALNRAMMVLSDRLGIPLVAVNDVRYVHPEDVDAHTVTLCLSRRGMTLEDKGHPRSTPGYHLRTAEEVLEAFQVHHPDIPSDLVAAAVERTLEVAERCQAELDVNPHRALIPDAGLPKGVTAFQEVKFLCREGWRWRNIPARAARLGKDKDVYIAQLRHELETIQRAHFSPYFLFVRDVIQWARSQGIMVGPGRGSAAGSLVCYLLGITSIDPIEHDLMFERFLAPGRIDMPDIDVDFPLSRREEVVEYIEKKYGRDRTAHIATFGRMHGKGALKDVCRVMGVPFSTVNDVTRTFPSRQGDEKRPVRSVLEGTGTGRGFMAEHPAALEIVETLEGMTRLIGVHAAGVVASPVPIWHYCPVESHKLKGSVTRITAVDMRGVESFGLLKIDALGLKNLDVLEDVRRAVLERTGEDIDFEALTFDDPRVIDAFTRQEFVGVFQFDAQSARSVCEGLTFREFRDVSALTALNRPGCTRSGLTDRYRARLKDPDKIKPFHPIVDHLTEDTLGVLVYQEQVIKLFRELAGFDAAQADKVRKKIGKKLGLDDEVDKFVAGAVEHGMDQDDAEGLMKSILKFGEYAFNRAHACSYAAIGYWQMWCKVNYPKEFIWALMRNAKDRDEAMGYVKEARRLGVPILPPDVNESGGRWTLVDAGIRAGLADVKHVGKTAVEAIEAAQPFTCLSDFMSRVPGRAATSRILGSLVRAGAMRSLLPNTKWALEHTEEWLDAARKKRAGWEEAVDAAVRASADLEDYGAEDLLVLALESSPQGSGRHPMDLYIPMFVEGGVLSTVEWTEIGDPKFWKAKAAFIAGVVVQIRHRQVGDGDPPPDEITAKKKQWGRQFAVVHVEDAAGNSKRVKIPPDTFDRFQEVVEGLKVGQCVALHVTLLAQYHSARANFVVDLEAVRPKIRLNIPLTGWERCLTDHPVLQYSRKALTRRRQNKFEATVLITNVRTTVDRNGNQMAFFGIQDGYGNASEVVAFSSVYEAHAELIESGAIVRLSIRKDRGNFVLTDEGITDEVCRI